MTADQIFLQHGCLGGIDDRVTKFSETSGYPVDCFLILQQGFHHGAGSVHLFPCRWSQIDRGLAVDNIFKIAEGQMFSVNGDFSVIHKDFPPLFKQRSNEKDRVSMDPALMIKGLYSRFGRYPIWDR